MNVTFRPSGAYGAVAAPPSKSMAHRLLLCAGLSPGKSAVEGLSPSQDVLATIDCLRALGARVECENGTAEIWGADLAATPGPLRFACRESGSTLRFFLPLAMAAGAGGVFTGSDRLLERPLTVYEEICRRQGMLFLRSETGLEVRGRLQSGLFRIPGDVSSQFATGLLFALPLLEGASDLELLPPVESRPYLELTLLALRQFGIRVIRVGDNHFHVPGCQTYQAQRARVEGDWSNAAYLEGLNPLGGQVRVTGLSPYSRQGDRVYREHFKTLERGFAAIDLSQCPDLGPVLFALAAALHGGLFTGTARLRLKESDRCAAMAVELEKLGIPTVVEEDHVWIGHGTLCQPSVPLDAHNDHRVAMALSLLLSRVGGTLEGAEAVDKSFPEYYDCLLRLGVDLTRTEA